MDETPDESKEPAQAPWPPQAIVTPDDFLSVDFNSVLRGINTAYDHRLETALMAAARENREAEPAFSVFRLLASVCGLHFRLHDKSGAFGPQMTLADGRRTSIPEDWRGEQNEHFFAVLDQVEHPALRARLADVVWSNDRRKIEAAGVAVVAYCQCAEALNGGEFEESFATEREVSIEALDLVERAAQIHSRSNKRGAPMHDWVAKLMHDLYAKARQHIDVGALHRLGSLLSRHSLISLDQLAEHVEAAAVQAEQMPEAYPLAIKELWLLAASAHEESKRPDDRTRCQLAAVEQTIKMASQTGSASGAAHWLRDAIGELRRIPGTENRREELRKEMRASQEKALEEMGSFELPMDLSDLVTGTIKVFEQLTLPQAIYEFASLAEAGSAANMRKEAAEAETGIADLFHSTFLDHDGKVIAEVEGAPSHGEAPSEAWVMQKMARNLQMRMDVAVRGQIEPVRRLLASQFSFSERHFKFIAVQSPFVPRHHASTFALGFARLMQGDLLSAGPILIPQLEECLRHVLVSTSTDTSKMRNDLTQEDRSLSTLLDLYRSDLVRVFGDNIVLHIDLIFNHRPGPALRHEFAHGKVGDRSIGNPEVYFACCFILMLTCAPLGRVWAQLVAPAIEAEAF